MNVIPEIAHYFSDGIYAKQMQIEKGRAVLTHSHHYSHLSILASGSVVVTCDGIDTTYDSPACVEIKAEVHHEIYALETSTFFCIHATDETDPDKVDATLIKEGA